MFTISIKEFILKGIFGPVKMGSTPEQVIELLGTPSFSNDLGYGSFALLYGWYEFFFFDDYLHAIQNDHLRADCINHADWILFNNDVFEIVIWPYKVNQDISLRSVIDLLKKEGTNFTVRNQISRSGLKEHNLGVIKIIDMNNGLTMDFEYDTREFIYDKKDKLIDSKEIIYTDEMDFVLNGIRFSDPSF